VESKRRGNIVKVRITQEDLPGLSGSLAFMALTALARSDPAFLKPIGSYSLELRGDIILTLAFSSDPAALLQSKEHSQDEP
jgi:hypothetical protein